MLGAQGLWAGRDLFRATPAVTRGLGFSGLIRNPDRPIQSPLTTRKGMRRIYSNPDPRGLRNLWRVKPFTKFVSVSSSSDFPLLQCFVGYTNILLL
jgi:hypothetical protein